jgi:hypothetical protein
MLNDLSALARARGSGGRARRDARSANGRGRGGARSAADGVAEVCCLLPRSRGGSPDERCGTLLRPSRFSDTRSVNGILHPSKLALLEGHASCRDPLHGRPSRRWYELALAERPLLTLKRWRASSLLTLCSPTPDLLDGTTRQAGYPRISVVDTAFTRSRPACHGSRYSLLAENSRHLARAPSRRVAGWSRARRARRVCGTLLLLPQV